MWQNIQIHQAALNLLEKSLHYLVLQIPQQEKNRTSSISQYCNFPEAQKIFHHRYSLEFNIVFATYIVAWHTNSHSGVS